MGRKVGRAAVALVVVVLGGAPAGATGHDGAAPPDEEQEALREAVAAVEAAVARQESARAAVAAATAASSRATAAVRASERALVPLVLERLAAVERAAAADRAVRWARTTLAARAEAVVAERERLDAHVRRAYKLGWAFEGAMALRIVTAARSPAELGRDLHDLSVLTRRQHGRIGAARDELDHGRRALVDALAVRNRTQRRATVATQRVVAAEARTAAQRRSADAAEARLLAASREALAAEEALVAARRLLPGREELEPAPALAERRAQLAARAAALARARQLPAERRRTRDDLVCPVPGGRFDDDWHVPRSNGRRHEGTDVFASHGTPVRAVVDARVVAVDRHDAYDGDGDGDLGGISVSYAAGDERWYAAHLDRVATGMVEGRELAAGDVVGWVGTTGNARGTPAHLHLGWYVHGIAVNPFPSLAVACRAAEASQEPTEEPTEVVGLPVGEWDERTGRPPRWPLAPA